MGPYIVFYAVLALLFVLSLTAGRRGFYHYACSRKVIRYDFGRPRPANPVRTEKP